MWHNSGYDYWTRKRFKGDDSVYPIEAFALSRDISDTYNEVLTKDVSDQEILDAVKQINPLKALSPEGMLGNILLEELGHCWEIRL